MKHKAQESLDALIDENKMDRFARGFSREDNYTSQFDYDNAEKYCFDKLNELIDLQLTKEEIHSLMVCMSYYSLRHQGLTKINNINVDYGSELYNKLERLKEMWEVDR